MPAQTQTKADAILDAAAGLFATKPFHEVRLEDIAALAHVGKGTVYLYWTSKEAVYMAVIRRGFADVLDRMERELADVRAGCWDQIRMIVSAVVDFAFAYPGVYQIMRSGLLTPEDPELQRIRRAMTDRIERTIIEGVESGQCQDTCPALTTQYLLSFARGALLYPPPGLTPELLKEHIVGVLRSGLAPRGQA